MPDSSEQLASWVDRNVEEILPQLTRLAARNYDWKRPWTGSTTLRPVKPLHVGVNDLLNRLGVTPTYEGADAYYDHITDELCLPPQSSFASSPVETHEQAFYHVLFHELTHWAGRHDRLNREVFGPGLLAYAREELVAEGSAAVLCARFGFLPEDLSSYIYFFRTWLNNAGDRDDAVAYAAFEIKRAATFILLEGQ